MITRCASTADGHEFDLHPLTGEGPGDGASADVTISSGLSVMFQKTNWEMHMNRTGRPRRSRRGAAALVLVATAASVAAFVAFGLLLAPVDRIGSGNRSTIGEVELVRITGPDGTTVEALARMDTGASVSAIDWEIAEALGLDIGTGSTMTVRSAFGSEERPVAEVAIQVAGVARSATVTIDDRSEVSNVVLLGRTELAGFTVSVGQEQLTEPGAYRAPNPVAVLLTSRDAAFAPASLIVLLAVAVALVVVLRNVVGLATLGTFTPILLTFGFLQAGLVPALILTLIVLVLGVLLEPWLRRYHLPRVARLGVLISGIAVVFVALETFTGLAGSAASWGAAFPVVVSAVIVERLWEEWELEGFRPALWAGVRTIGVALLALPVLTAPTVRWLAETAPLALAVAAVIWTWIAGTYRGLRLTELLRFEATTEPTDFPAFEEA